MAPRAPPQHDDVHPDLREDLGAAAAHDDAAGLLGAPLVRGGRGGGQLHVPLPLSLRGYDDARVQGGLARVDVPAAERLGRSGVTLRSANTIMFRPSAIQYSRNTCTGTLAPDTPR